MSQRRLNDSSEVGSVSIAPYEYAAVYDYLGKNRYLQAAFCKTVARLYSDKFGMYTTKALSNIAAEEGFTGLLKWCKDIGCYWGPSVFVSGASGGHVGILKFLRDSDCPISTGNAAWRVAAGRGHVEVLKFARQSNYLQNTNSGSLCEVAAVNGHIHILEWVHEVEGTRHFNANTCKQAATGGFIEIIKWLHGLGCEWSADTCLAAISNGHVGVLKWALDNGCPFAINDKGSFGRTGLHYAGNAEVIEFLISRGAKINALDTYGRTPIHSATEKCKLEAVKSFVRLGADVNLTHSLCGSPLDTAIRRGNLAIVEVLRAAGARESHYA